MFHVIPVLSRLIKNTIDKFETWIDRKEKKELFFYLLVFITIRALSESIFEQPHAVEIKIDFLVHHYLFFISLLLIIFPYFKMQVGKQKAFKILCLGFVVIIIPPYFDFIITGGKGYRLLYVPEPKDIINIYFSLFLSPFTYYAGSSPGMKLEVLIASLFSSIYFFYKKRRFKLLFSVLNFFILPLFPLLLGSIFSFRTLFYSFFFTPSFIYSATVYNTFYIYVLFFLVFIFFREYFPKRVELTAFIFPLINLAIIVIYSIKISQFVPDFIFMPGNVIYFLNSAFAVFFLLIGIKRDEINLLSLAFAVLFAITLSTAYIIAFFAFAFIIFVFKNNHILKYLFSFIFSIFLGICFYALGGRIPFPDLSSYSKRLGAEIFYKERQYKKSIKLLSSIKSPDFIDYINLSKNFLALKDYYNAFHFFQKARDKYELASPYYSTVIHKKMLWEVNKELVEEYEIVPFFYFTISLLNPRIDNTEIIQYLDSIAIHYLAFYERTKWRSFFNMYIKK